MRKITVHLIVALCTFILGSSLAFWSRCQRAISPSLDETRPTSPQTCKDKAALDPDAGPSASVSLPLLAYCELVGNSSCYSGKIVRVRAKLSWNDHGMLLYGETCNNGDSMAAGRLSGATPEAFKKLLAKVCDKQCSKPLDIVVISRFDEVTPSGRTDMNWDTHPLHLELLRIEEMSEEH